jgi:hypothetical protein
MKKTEQDIIAEAITEAVIKHFPKSREDHKERLHNTHLFNTYHKALAHAKTLSDNDLAARIKRHEGERHEAWHEDNPARQNPDGNIPKIEELHYRANAYRYEHRQRRGERHPDLDSFTPEYVDRVLKDRY